MSLRFKCNYMQTYLFDIAVMSTRLQFYAFFTHVRIDRVYV